METKQEFISSPSPSLWPLLSPTMHTYLTSDVIDDKNCTTNNNVGDDIIMLADQTDFNIYRRINAEKQIYKPNFDKLCRNNEIENGNIGNEKYNCDNNITDTSTIENSLVTTHFFNANKNNAKIKKGEAVYQLQRESMLAVSNNINPVAKKNSDYNTFVPSDIELLNEYQDTSLFSIDFSYECNYSSINYGNTLDSISSQLINDHSTLLQQCNEDTSTNDIDSILKNEIQKLNLPEVKTEVRINSYRINDAIHNTTQNNYFYRKCSINEEILDNNNRLDGGKKIPKEILGFIDDKENTFNNSNKLVAREGDKVSETNEFNVNTNLVLTDDHQEEIDDLKQLLGRSFYNEQDLFMNGDKNIQEKGDKVNVDVILHKEKDFSSTGNNSIKVNANISDIILNRSTEENLELGMEIVEENILQDKSFYNSYCSLREKTLKDDEIRKLLNKKEASNDSEKEGDTSCRVLCSSDIDNGNDHTNKGGFNKESDTIGIKNKDVYHSKQFYNCSETAKDKKLILFNKIILPVDKNCMSNPNSNINYIKFQIDHKENLTGNTTTNHSKNGNYLIVKINSSALNRNVSLTGSEQNNNNFCSQNNRIDESKTFERKLANIPKENLIDICDTEISKLNNTSTCDFNVTEQNNAEISLQRNNKIIFINFGNSDHITNTYNANPRKQNSTDTFDTKTSIENNFVTENIKQNFTNNRDGSILKENNKINIFESSETKNESEKTSIPNVLKLDSDLCNDNITKNTESNNFGINVSKQNESNVSCIDKLKQNATNFCDSNRLKHNARSVYQSNCKKQSNQNKIFDLPINKTSTENSSGIKTITYLKKDDGGPDNIDKNIIKQRKFKNKSINHNHSVKNNNKKIKSNRKLFTSHYNKIKNIEIKNQSDSNYFCLACKMKFTNKIDYKNHVKNCKNKIIKTNYKCQDCGKIFRFKQSLNRHKKFIHDGIKPFTCTVCDKKFTRKISLDLHQLLHKGIKNEICKICGNKFSLKRNLKSHLLIVHNITSNYENNENEIRLYTCEICNKGFKQNKNLKEHKLIHLNDKNDNKNKRKCLICNKLYKQSTFRKHFNRKHKNIIKSATKNIKKYTCNYCDVIFNSRSDIIDHLGKNHNNINHRYQCDKCDKNYKLKYSLKNHKIVHDKKNIRPFECDKCLKTFQTKSILYRHQIVHSNVKNFKCNNCDKLYSHKHNLLNHINKMKH